MLEWTERRLVSLPGSQDFYTLESKHNVGKMRLQMWHPQSRKMEWPETAAPRQVQGDQRGTSRLWMLMWQKHLKVSGGEPLSEQKPTEYSQGPHLLPWPELQPPS